ncbi:MAG TPA: tryptophan--tRNA ligase, partial [Acidimicrobiia bacterium]|nr:tryptophan--tRNA ligase [Acidimicrobiia bacterium]
TKPGVSNLLEILAAATDRPVAAVEAEFGGSGYGALKTTVAEAVVEVLAPLQERYAVVAADPGEVDRVLAAGAERARAIAGGVMDRVRSASGLLAPTPA